MMKRLHYWIFGEKSGTRTKFNRNTCQLRLFLIILAIFLLSDHFPSSAICQMADSHFKFLTPTCGLWWTVQNQSTFLVFPQTTWPGHDSQEKALNSRFPENQPHQHLMRVHECKFVSLSVV